eukprot:snap_masked-scaffold_32-processed-gene-1.25-mRNA-1 protein AED:1.00 eAED:1.00 QI:0/-1/0/0/-1/1/1/0/125
MNNLPVAAVIDKTNSSSNSIDSHITIDAVEDIENPESFPVAHRMESYRELQGQIIEPEESEEFNSVDGNAPSAFVSQDKGCKETFYTCIRSDTFVFFACITFFILARQLLAQFSEDDSENDDDLP